MIHARHVVYHVDHVVPRSEYVLLRADSSYLIINNKCNIGRYDHSSIESSDDICT